MMTAWAQPVLAIGPDEILDDPVLEIRARSISKHLRCVVCQNQSIDDSNAEIARDMRLIVRERLVAGDSDDEAISYLVSRYGDYVLLQPPFKAATLPLWLGPPILVLFVGFLVIVRTRRKLVQSAKSSAGSNSHSAADAKRLDAIISATPTSDDTNETMGKTLS